MNQVVELKTMQREWVEEFLADPTKGMVETPCLMAESGKCTRLDLNGYGCGNCGHSIDDQEVIARMVNKNSGQDLKEVLIKKSRSHSMAKTELVSAGKKVTVEHLNGRASLAMALSEKLE